MNTGEKLSITETYAESLRKCSQNSPESASAQSKMDEQTNMNFEGEKDAEGFYIPSSIKYPSLIRISTVA